MSDNERLQRDLTQATELLRRWATDPARVAVDYGLARSESEVRVKFASGSSDLTDDRKAKKFCSCLCTGNYEYEYESD